MVTTHKQVPGGIDDQFCLVTPFHNRWRTLLPITPALDASVQVGLFLYWLICQLSTDFLFQLNILFGEGACKVFWLEDLADLDFRFACVAVGGALDPLDGLFEGLDLQDHEASDEFLGSAKGPSVTVRFLPEKWTRAPLEEGWRPS